MEYCALKDLCFTGFPYTWCNRRPGDQNTWIRLDRGVAIVDWVLHFPTFRIHHMDAFHFDHKPLLLCSNSEFKRFYRKGSPFCFKAMWLKDSTCEDVIKQSWEGEPIPNIDWGFNRKITACQMNLRVWNKNCFRHVCNNLAKKLKDLKWAEEEGCYVSNPEKIY